MKLKKVLLLCVIFIISMLLICGTSYAVTDEDGNEITIESMYKYETRENGNLTIKGVTDKFRLYYEDNYDVLEFPNKINGITVDNVQFAVESAGKFKKIVLPEAMEQIPKHILSNCKYMEELVIPDGVKIIGEDSISGCIRLRSVELPDSVLKIGNLAFANCTHLKEINLPENLRKIGTGAFQNCSSLKSISFGSKIKCIEEKTFDGCTSLKEVELSKKVNTIGIYAFNGCTSLESVTIKNKKAAIGKNAFSGISGLTIYGYTKSTAETYAKNNKINFVALSEISQVEKAGILMSAFASQCIDKYAYKFNYNEKHPDRATYVFNYPGNGTVPDNQLTLDCVGNLNLFIYQSTGLWSRYGRFPSGDDPIYISPWGANTKLGASDLFEFVYGKSDDTGTYNTLNKQTLESYAGSGNLKPGDLIMLSGHVTMYCGYGTYVSGNGATYTGAMYPDNYSERRFLYWASKNGGAFSSSACVLRIKEEAANEITELYDLNTKEEIEAYGRALADAYFKGSTKYKKETLERKICSKVHRMVGDSQKPEFTTAKVKETDEKPKKIAKNVGGKTVKQVKDGLMESNAYACVEILDKLGNIITNEDMLMGTGMTIKTYVIDNSGEVGTANLDIIAAVVGEENAEPENGEYSVIVYGDVTGKGNPGAVDALTIVHNNNGQKEFESDLYYISGRVTKNSREDDTLPSSIDALAIVKSKLGYEPITQGEYREEFEEEDEEEDEEIEELLADEDNKFVPIYTREDLEQVGTGYLYYNSTTQKTYQMDPDSKYVLMADIDLGEAEWTPLGQRNFIDEDGNTRNTILTNEFNGNGHIIKNMTVNGYIYNSYEGQPVGLFSECNALICNLTLEDACVTVDKGVSYAGTVVGKYVVTNETPELILENVNRTTNTTEKAINSVINEEDKNEEIAAKKDQCLGGLIGAIVYDDNYEKEDNSVIVSDCSCEGITYKAGLIGICKVNINVEGCSNDSNVDANKSAVGGIIGNVVDSKITMNYCVNNGSINKSNYDDNAGGILGKLEDEKTYVRLFKCTNNGEINGGYRTGGIIGLIENKLTDEEKNIMILKCENKAAIKAYSYVGGIVGNINNRKYNVLVNIIKCKNEGTIEAGFAVGGIVGGIDNNAFNNGDNTYSLAKYKKVNIISNENYGDVLHGNGDNGGIIGACWNINNLVCTDCINYGNVETANSTQVGGIIGYYDQKSEDSPCILSNCKNSGIINSFERFTNNGGYAGGIIGPCYCTGDLQILSCENTANVYGAYSVGGCMAYYNGSESLIVRGCKNSGDISGIKDHGVYIGGILGEIHCNKTVEVTNNSNSGNVSATDNTYTVYAGGITGRIDTDFENLILDGNSSTGTIYSPKRYETQPEADPLYGEPDFLKKYQALNN